MNGDGQRPRGRAEPTLGAQSPGVGTWHWGWMGTALAGGSSLVAAEMSNTALFVARTYPTPRGIFGYIQGMDCNREQERAPFGYGAAGRAQPQPSPPP